MYTSEQLAKLTGLPNLDNVSDPARLARLVDAAWRKLDGMYQVTGLRCPLRYKVAAKEYALAAEAKLAC